MTTFEMKEGVVLIIPGYTEYEKLQMENNKKKSKSSSSSSSTTYIQKNKSGSTSKKQTSTKKKTTTKKTSASIKTTQQVTKPKAMYFRVSNLEYTPHNKDYEEFNSSEGLILVEKACDRFAEVKFDVFVHQKLSTLSGSFKLGNETTKTDIFVEDFTQNHTTDGFEIWEYPKNFSDRYVELRRSFFDNLRGRSLTVISDLFPNIVAGYITELDYDIKEGEAEATYSVTIREVDNIV